MQRTMLKSKIHRATVTDCDLHYVGSITVDPDLLEAADILEHEQVAVVDVDNGARFETYTIAGERGSGEMKVNGAAARLVHRGDTIIVISYASVRPHGDGALRAARRPRRGRDNRDPRPSMPRSRPCSHGGSLTCQRQSLPDRRRRRRRPPAGHAPAPAEKKALGEPIVMVTAYDFPSAPVAEDGRRRPRARRRLRRHDRARLPDRPCRSPLDEMLMLAAAARRGLRTPFLVGDLPFGSYEVSDEQAVAHRPALRQGGGLRRRQARGRRRDVGRRARGRSSTPASRSWATSA